MSHRMGEIKPAHHVTEEKCQEMIDAAIRQHNRNASIISMCLGILFLAAFVDGFLRAIGIVPPFMDIDINLMNKVIEQVKSEVIKVVT